LEPWKESSDLEVRRLSSGRLGRRNGCGGFFTRIERSATIVARVAATQAGNDTGSGGGMGSEAFTYLQSPPVGFRVFQSMGTTEISLLTFASVFGAALLGMALRSRLPEHHLNAETKDTVKLAMGFVATMSALILGLLVASAKDSYDKQLSSVTQMAAKVVYLDRVLANFGPEAKDVRTLYRQVVEQVEMLMWPHSDHEEFELDPSAVNAESLFTAIEALQSTNETQATLKSQAVSASLELGQLRWLVYEQASSTASKTMLCILVFWTSVLFASFGMFAPRNGTVIAALMLAALSVAGAIFLIEELRSPFAGLLQIPNTAFVDAIGHLGK
jgi:hypothetical protein